MRETRDRGRTSLTRRRGTKWRLAAHFAAIWVRVADGPRQRIQDMGAQNMLGEEVWLIGEHRSNGERKYYLSNLPPETPLKALARAIKGCAYRKSHLGWHMRSDAVALAG